MVDAFNTFIEGMGIFSVTWQMIVMWLVVAVLLYMGVAKQFEPLLLVPIAFGALIANIPDNGMVLTQANRDIISINEKGQVEKQTMKDVGFLRIKLAPLVEETKSIDGVTDANYLSYFEAVEQPMIAEQAYAPQLAGKDDAAAKALGYEAGQPLFFDAEGTLVAPRTVGGKTRPQLFDDNGKAVADGTEGAKPRALKGQLTITGQKSLDYAVYSIHGGLYDFIGLGIKSELFPPLIFLGVGALTDFGPLLAAPRALLLGAAAQIGVAFTFFMAILMGFTRTGRFDRHHRRGRRPDLDLPVLEAGSRTARSHRRGGLYLHGSGAADSAADHEASDDKT